MTDNFEVSNESTETQNPDEPSLSVCRTLERMYFGTRKLIVHGSAHIYDLVRNTTSLRQNYL